MKKFLVFMADGTEEIEALTVVDYLRRSDILVDTVSINGTYEIVSSHDIKIKTDKKMEEIKEDDYMGLYVPGGTKGAMALRDDKRVRDLVKNFFDDKKIVSAICAGPIVLEKAGVLENKRATSFPAMEDEFKNIGEYVKDELVVIDGNLITSRGAGATIYLSLKLIELIKGEDAKESLKPNIQQNFVEEYFSFKF